jgi:hypothetical protein
VAIALQTNGREPQEPTRFDRILERFLIFVTVVTLAAALLSLIVELVSRLT